MIEIKRIGVELNHIIKKSILILILDLWNLDFYASNLVAILISKRKRKMYNLGKAMVLASVILSLSIQITESLYPKQFLVEENRRGINGMLESGSWKLIRSKGVSYTQCLVSILKYRSSLNVQKNSRKVIDLNNPSQKFF